MIKIVATNLDGTLLSKENKLPSEFNHLLKHILHKNIKFVIASGRPYYTLKEDFEELSNKLIFLADNGATIVENNEITYCNSIKPDVLKRVIEVYKKLNNIYMILCGKNCAYIDNTDKDFINEMEKYFYKYDVVENIEDVKDDIVKITFCKFNNINKDYTDIFYPGFEDCLQMSLSGEIWLDLTSLNTNKGNSLKKIQEKYVITNGETLAFGDYYNDISLFSRAYFSYAMENSPDKVKEHAKYIIEGVPYDGVIKVLKNKFENF
ncbi:Cof-type HAD-IIB family hydrolase [Clostridium carnis]